jgi:hypothetical protein
MPTLPTILEIEEYLLGLVARDRGVSIAVLREEELAKPYDPPWSSEEFVHYQFEIETTYGIDFDPVAVEKVQRNVTLLTRHIQNLITAAQSETA